MAFLDRILMAPINYASRQPHVAWGLVGASTFMFKFWHINFLHGRDYAVWIKERQGEIEGLK